MNDIPIYTADGTRLAVTAYDEGNLFLSIQVKGATAYTTLSFGEARLLAEKLLEVVVGTVE